MLFHGLGFTGCDTVHAAALHRGKGRSSGSRAGAYTSVFPLSPANIVPLRLMENTKQCNSHLSSTPHSPHTGPVPGRWTSTHCEQPRKLKAVDSCLASTPGLVLTQAQQWIPASASTLWSPMSPWAQATPAAASSSSGVLLQCSPAPHSCHLTLCPCCSNKLHSHRSRLGAFPSGDGLPGTPHRSNSPSSDAGSTVEPSARTHLQHGAVQPYSNHSRNRWVGFSCLWCEGT